jgi:hypothetical protein
MIHPRCLDRWTFRPIACAIELALWAAIAPLVDQLDEKVGQSNVAVLRGLKRADRKEDRELDR